MQQQTSKSIPSNWPVTTAVETTPFLQSIRNCLATYRSGLRTGQRRIGISPVNVIMGPDAQSLGPATQSIAYALDVAHTLGPFVA